MTERLLQFIWQLQYFNKSQLQTTNGERLQIIFQGNLNTNQGPDFTNAQIKIDDTILAGSVELHLQTSQWNDHGHQNDANYKNVILHVVFENDAEIHDSIPVLEIQPLVSKILLERYNYLMNASSFIACSNTINEVKEITWAAWKERLLAERLTRKSNLIFEFLEQNNFHWEESFWWMISRNFGAKVNSDAFEAIARSVSTTVLAKHKNQLQQLEALLLGQAGLLTTEFKEDYPKLLQREYNFLKKKYHLQSIHIPVHFLRMRPGNFPTIRLAQLAVLIQSSAHLFSKILDAENITGIKKLFNLTANDYWHYHYIIDDPSQFKKKIVGKDMINNIIINTIVPMLFAYGQYHKEEKYKLKAITWLEQISSEINSVTKGFTQLSLSNKSAFDSQAFIELKTQYCNHKHCLKCSVGNAILKTV